MLNWNSNCELDRASISNFKAPGVEIQKGNCSKLSFISDILFFQMQPINLEAALFKTRCLFSGVKIFFVKIVME